jgi:quercetin dioxygenase-like cupin family protein
MQARASVLLLDPAGSGGLGESAAWATNGYRGGGRGDMVPFRGRRHRSGPTAASATDRARYDAPMAPDPVTVALDLNTEERFVPLRKLLGVSGFGINQLTLQPGQRMRIHRHSRQEEVYLVIEGRLTIFVEGEAHTLAAGELMRIAPGVRRQLANTHRERVALVALGSSGNGHESRDAEAFNTWEETTGGQPREVPLPSDLPDSELQD